MSKEIGRSKHRASNIELLRIVCMIAVVACHWAAHGAWENNFIGINGQLVSILPRGGTLAINVFVIISGYFGINSVRSIKKKVGALWIDRFFYAVSISTVMLMLGASFDINYVLRAIFPVITCRHNYVTTFIFYIYLRPT